jgi:hypothetical protein
MLFTYELMLATAYKNIMALPQKREKSAKKCHYLLHWASGCSCPGLSRVYD